MGGCEIWHSIGNSSKNIVDDASLYTNGEFQQATLKMFSEHKCIPMMSTQRPGAVTG